MNSTNPTNPIIQSDLEKLTRALGTLPATVELILSTKEADPLSQDIEQFARTLSDLFPKKITLSESSTKQLIVDLPGMTIACGKAQNIHYLCVPEQNEIIPFAHALTVAAQGEAPVSATIKASAQQIETPTEIIVLVSPFCTNCPLVVQTVLNLAATNPLISAYVLDVQHAGDITERFGIQSVPATIMDRHLVHIGEITPERLLEIILNRGTATYTRDFMRSLIDRGHIDDAADLLCKERDAAGMVSLFEEGDLSMRMGVLVVFEEALGKDRAGIQQMVPRLIGMLTHDDARIRGDMAALLGEIGDPRALPHLERLINDPDPDVVEAVEEAIEMLRQG